MARIEMVIKVDERDVDLVRKNFKPTGYSFIPLHIQTEFVSAILNGTPLPKRHGRLIDKDHMIARLEAASKFYGGENADAFDERFSHGLKEAAIKVCEEPTIIEADKAESKEAQSKQTVDSCLDFDFDKVKETLKNANLNNLIIDHTCEEN